MSDPSKLEALRQQSIPHIVPQLADLTDAELAELLAAEQNEDNGGRKGLIEAIELDQLHRADAAAEKAAEEEPEAAPQPVAPSVPWQDPDYAGAMTGAQALWRHAHLKDSVGG